MPKSRKKNRVVPPTIRVFCEGAKTEPTYLKDYIDNLPEASRRFVVSVEPTKKNTPAQLVDEAVAYKKSDRFVEGDLIWVVYDREAVAKYPDENHAKAYKKAEDNGVKVALSNICFEYWLLLHLCDSTAPYSSFDDLCKSSNFRKLFKDKSGKEYDKSSALVFNVLKDGLSKARERAERNNAKSVEAAPKGGDQPYRLNPYTDVYLLLNAIDTLDGEGVE